MPEIKLRIIGDIMHYMYVAPDGTERDLTAEGQILWGLYEAGKVLDMSMEELDRFLVKDGDSIDW